MEKEEIFSRIELLQEQKRRSVVYGNYRLEIDCMLSIIDQYELLCKYDSENKDKYVRTIEEQTKIVRQAMQEHNYYGEKTRVQDVNNDIVTTKTLHYSFTKK